MRECGLKHQQSPGSGLVFSVTPHAGVWIETWHSRRASNKEQVTPHAGVWIETVLVE